VGIIARVPAGRDRREPLVQFGADAHEGGPARGAEPLVGAARQHVDTRGVDREPATRLRRVHHHERAVRRGGLHHRIEIRKFSRG
jgi:hypothetical protein